MQHVGSRIKDLVRGSNYSVKEISEKLEISTPNVYRLFERESVETKYLIKLSELFNISIAYFFPNSNVLSSNSELDELKKQISELAEKLDFLKRENQMLTELRLNCEEKLSQKIDQYKFLDKFFEVVKQGNYGKSNQNTQKGILEFGLQLVRNGEVGAYRFVTKVSKDPELLRLFNHVFNGEEPPMSV